MTTDSTSKTVAGCEVGKIVLPGDRLCRSNEKIVAGQGTHEFLGWLHACWIGTICVKKDTDKETVSIVPKQSEVSVPGVNSIVVCKVMKVTSRSVTCLLLACDSHRLIGGFRGQIRREDVRATERDSVNLLDCFRPGDVVQARVMTLGQGMTYLLTTAENELGVVFALGPTGRPLVPVDWVSFACPLTGEKFKRKVAKVPPEFVDSLLKLFPS